MREDDHIIIAITTPTRASGVNDREKGETPFVSSSDVESESEAVEVEALQSKLERTSINKNVVRTRSSQ